MSVRRLRESRRGGSTIQGLSFVMRNVAADMPMTAVGVLRDVMLRVARWLILMAVMIVLHMMLMALMMFVIVCSTIATVCIKLGWWQKK